MRLPALIIVAISLLAISACSATPKNRTDYPDAFADALEETYDLSQRLDQEIVTKSWVRARKGAFELLNMTNHLLQYEPLKGIDEARDYDTYQSRIKGLHYAADKLKEMVDLHRRGDAIEWMDTYIERYNAISTQFGDGVELVGTPRPRPVSASGR